MVSPAAGLTCTKDGIVVAIADNGLRDEVREYDRIAKTPAALVVLCANSARMARGCGSSRRMGSFRRAVPVSLKKDLRGQLPV